MKILDLFCGAGGCSKGYANAGFDRVIGVDIKNQPRYPYHLIIDDAIEYLEETELSQFDLIHASPPCQAYSWSARQSGINHPELIDIVREILEAKCVNYVIENVVGAPLKDPITLEGPMFGLKVIRKRLFETNWPLCQLQRVKASGRVKDGEYVTVAGHGGNGGRDIMTWRLAMGIPWMNEKELTQAIPPRYTEYIGREFLSWYEKEKSH